jgi:amino acid permease
MRHVGTVRNQDLLVASSSQEESAILWEVIVCVILSKKVHMNMGPILNGYRDNITTNITCIVIRSVNQHVLLM